MYCIYIIVIVDISFCMSKEVNLQFWETFHWGGGGTWESCWMTLALIHGKCYIHNCDRNSLSLKWCLICIQHSFIWNRILHVIVSNEPNTCVVYGNFFISDMPVKPLVAHHNLCCQVMKCWYFIEKFEIRVIFCYLDMYVIDFCPWLQ